MNVVTIFWYTLKQNWRDRSTYMEMLALPLVLIFILGASLNTSFQIHRLPTIETALYIEGGGPAAVGLEQFLLENEREQLLNLHRVFSPEEGQRQLEAGERHAFIHMTSGEEAALPAAIHLTVSGQNSLRTKVMESLLNSYVSSLSSTLPPEKIHPRSLSPSDVMPGAIDYYAVTMLVMFLMYGAFYSVYGMKQSYLGPVGKRMASTPLPPRQHYLGLVLASVTTMMLQAVIIIGFTRWVFRVNWGTNPLLVGLIVLLTGLFATGMGTALAMLIQEETLAGNILNVLVPVMTFMAGGFFRINIAPGSWMAYGQFLSPNYLAQTALFTTIYGGDQETLLVTLGIMGLLIVATFMAAILSERRPRI